MKKYLLPFILLLVALQLKAQNLITEQNITDKAIDGTKEIGCLAGSASVSLSGNATYSIPVYIPEGIRGMQPNVSINYSSGSGNGLVGYGWNLSAYSAISYDTKNLYNDGIVQPNYVDGGSPYLLDGGRLIPISGTEFRTESESFSKISPDNAAAPTKFTVITKSGITMEYGFTTNAQVVNNGKIVKWLLNKTSDNIGNSIVYAYGIENGETLLKTITYTVNANVSTLYNNTITFNYINRTDNNIFFSMEANAATVAPIYKKNILKSIEVKAESENVKKYDFAYGEDGLYTYLNEVTEIGYEIGGTPKPLNSTIFKYGLANPTTNSSETFTPAASQSSGNKPELLTGDFNGDGLEDIFVAYYSQAANYPKKYSDYKVYLRNSTGTAFPAAATPSASGTFPTTCYWNGNTATTGTVCSLYVELYVTDVDGNGKKDITVVKRGKTSAMSERLFGADVLYGNATASSFTLQSYSTNITSTFIGDVSISNYFLVGDFDGDNRTDWITTATNGTTNSVLLHLPALGMYNKYLSDYGTQTFDNCLGNNIRYASKLNIADFNGDGKQDIMAIAANVPYSLDCYGENQKSVYTINAETNNLYSVQSIAFDIANNVSTISDVNKKEIDFNGDGKADYFNDFSILRYSTGRAHTVNYTINIIEYSDTNITKLSSNDRAILLGDYNGDGKTDIAFYYFLSNTHNFAVYYSNGLSFKRELSTFTFGTGFRPSATADFNGDGRDDIIDTIAGGTGQIQIVNLKPKNQELLLTKVKDGFERMTEFTYKLHIDPTVYTYTNPSTNTYPLNTIVPNSFAVSKMITPNGTGDMANTTFTEYNYANAITHKAGKGFLGYTTTKSRNNLTTITSEQNNDFLPNDPITTTNFYLFGLKNAKSYYSTNISTPGTNLTLSTPTYQTTDLTNKRFFLKTTKTVDKNFVADVENETNYTIDANGNSTTIENKIKAISTNTTKQTTTTSVGIAPNDFIAAPPSLIPSLPIEVTTSNSYNGSYSTTTKYTYSNGLLQSVINFYNTPKATTTTYEYDGGLGLTVGLLTKQTITLNQPLPSSEYVGYQGAKYTKYEYFPNKRTIKKTFTMGTAAELLTQEVLTYDKRFNIPSSVQDGIYTNFVTNTTSIDAFGRVLSTTQLPNNITTSTEYAWDNSVTNGIYKVTSTSKATTNTPQTTKTAIGYFDRFARTIKTTTDNFSGTSDATVNYDAFGRVAVTTAPDASNAGTPMTVTNNYSPSASNHYRITSVANSVTGTTSYDYSTPTTDGKTTVKVTAPSGEFKQQVTDATGRLTTSTDAAGSITYNYNGQGKTVSIVAATATTTMQYDGITGEQLKLIEPNTGTTDYKYNGFGELIYQKDAKGFEYNMEYDILGRIKKKTRKTYSAVPNTFPASASDEVTTYEYKLANPGKEKLEYVKVNNNTVQTYGYDPLHRANSITEVVNPTNTFKTETVYNSDNSIFSVSYPNSVTLNYEYTTKGFLQFVKNGNLKIYEQTGATKYNAPRTYKLNDGNILSNIDYNPAGNATRYNSAKATTPALFDVQDLNMTYNPNTGNLLTRTDKTKGVSPWQSETFTYEDNRDRLSTIKINASTPTSMVYDDTKNGNIKRKPDASTQDYTYDGIKLHAVKEIKYACAGTVKNYKEGQTIAYTPFNKAATLTQIDTVGVSTPVANLVTYTYGTNEERTISEYKKDGVVQTKRYYLGNYEKLETYTSGTLTNTKHIYYISGANGLCAIATKDNGASSLTYNYVFTDHLGSILKLTNNAGAAVAEQSFDAWGRLRNPTTWSDYTPLGIAQPINSPLGAGGAPSGAGAGWLTRGYTGHEHVPQVDLINMNGRMYDAVVGRMLSADRYVQDATNSQDYNRYSYVRNNPLKYTDPSGWKRLFLGPDDNAKESGDRDSGGGGGGGGASFMSSYSDIAGFGSNLTSWGTTMLGATFYAPSAQYYVNSVTGNYMFGNKVIDRKQYLAGSYITKNMLGRVSYKKKTGEWGYWTLFNSNEDGEIKGDINTGGAIPQINASAKWNAYVGGEHNYYSSAIPFALTAAAADGPMPIGDIIGAGVLATAAVADASTRVYVTYVLTNGKGQYYVGRTSGHGDPETLANRRYYGHQVLQALGFGPPTVDQSAVGYPIGKWAIRGREQDVFDALVNQVGRVNVFNAINPVWQYNPQKPVYMWLSKAFPPFTLP